MTEIGHRDCGGSLESAAEKLKKVTAEIETSRIKKNFKRVRYCHSYLCYLESYNLVL